MQDLINVGVGVGVSFIVFLSLLSARLAFDLYVCLIDYNTHK